MADCVRNNLACNLDFRHCTVLSTVRETYSAVCMFVDSETISFFNGFEVKVHNIPFKGGYFLCGAPFSSIDAFQQTVHKHLDKNVI